MPRGHRRRAALLVAASAASLLLAACGSASAPSGLAPHGLETFEGVELFQISCPTQGACVALGSRPEGDVAVAVDQAGHTWTSPVLLHAPAGFGDGRMFASCSSAGNCVADMLGGDDTEVMPVAEEHGGRWVDVHRISIPHSSALFGQGIACARGGLCWVAVDQFVNVVAAHGATSTTWSYAIGEDKGRWLPPYRLGGPRLRAGGRRAVGVLAHHLACWSSSCTAFGVAVAAAGVSAPFVQTETAGDWQPPSMLPTASWSGRAATFLPGVDGTQPLACTAVGSCLLVGQEGADGQVATIAQEVDGRWRQPSDPVDVAGEYVVSAIPLVACHTRALCVAAGITQSGHEDVPYVQREVGGRWQPPYEMRGLALNGIELITGLSCPSATTCDLVGLLSVSSHRSYSFVAGYQGSSWHYSLVSFHGSVNGIDLTGLSCGGVSCWASGFATDSRRGSTGFVFPFPTLSHDSGLTS